MTKFVRTLLATLLLASVITSTWANTLPGRGLHAIQSSPAAITQAPAWANTIAQSEWSRYSMPTTAPSYLYVTNEHIRVLDNGVTHSFRQVVIGANTPQAIREQASQAIPFHPDMESIEIHAVKIYRDNAVVDMTHRLLVTAQPIRNDLPSVYTSAHSLLIEIPEIQSGDIIEVHLSSIGNNPVYQDRPWRSFDFYPVLHTGLLRFEMSWPEQMRISPSVLPASSPRQSLQHATKRNDFVQAGHKHVRFSARDIPPHQIEEANAMGTTQVDLIGFTSFAGLAEVIDWGAALFAGLPPPSLPVFTQKVASLKELATPQEQVAAALAWVQTEIRYVALLIGENTHRPFAPDEVLRRGFGDCKDKSLLLVHLLRALGIEAHTALMLQNNPQLPTRLPNFPLYDHVVVVVSINELDFVLDATLPSQASPLHVRGYWHAGADLLVLSGPKKGFLRAPNTTDPLQTSFYYDETMRLDASGRHGLLTITKTLRNTEAENMRWALHSHPVEQVKAHYLGQVRERYARAGWAGEPSVFDHLESNALTLEGSFNVPIPLRRASNGTMHFFLTNQNVGVLLATGGGPGRVTPLGLRTDVKTVEVVNRVEVPEGWRFTEQPVSDKLSNLWFDFSIHQRMISPNVLEDKKKLHIKVERIEPHELEQYLEAAENVFQFGNFLTLQAP